MPGSWHTEPGSSVACGAFDDFRNA